MQYFSRTLKSIEHKWLNSELAKTIQLNLGLRSYWEYLSSKDSPKILIFGDSVVDYVARNEQSHESLRELYINLFGKLANTFVVAGRGYHSELYFSYCRFIAQTTNPPNLVIVPINIRSFSPSWDLDPQFQFVELISELDEAYHGNKKFFYKMPRITPLSNSIFSSVPLKFPGKNWMTIGDYRSISRNKPNSETDPLWAKRLDNIFTYHYMFPIYKQHRKLINLCQIVKLLQQNDVRILIYVTPINYRAGLKFVGEQFVDVVNSNIKIISESLLDLDIHEVQPPKVSPGVFLNYAYRFNSSAFFTSHNSTEHIRFDERTELANRLASVAKEMMHL